APAGVDRDALLSADHVGDRRGDRHLLDRHLPDFLAGVRAIGGESLADLALEHEIPGGDEDSAAALLLVGRAPCLTALHRVPGDQPALRMGIGVFGYLAPLGVVASPAG